MRNPLLIQSSISSNSSKSSSLYPLQAQRGQMSRQPPIAHVQKYERPCPVPTTTPNRPLGVDAVHYRECPLLAQRGQIIRQPPIAHVQQYERACPVPTTTLNRPLGVDAVHYREYPLLAQRGQVSGQPPIAPVQPYKCAFPTAALIKPLGVNAVYYRPTVDVPVVAQYYASATCSPKDTSLVHTHMSYSNQPISDFIGNSENWTLALDVRIPEDLVHPTLTSLSYTVKYSTANDHLACVVRSNILLATIESEELGDKKTSEATAPVCLSSVLGIKANDLENQWNHFVDRQEIPVNARIENSHLYLQIHISEYPTVAMLRSLSIDIFATWLGGDEGVHVKKAADEMKAKEEQGRKAAEKQKAEELARKEAEAKKKVAEVKVEREKQVGSAADEKMQEKIQKALDRLPKELIPLVLPRTSSNPNTTYATKAVCPSIAAELVKSDG
ncbi:uncharacterized protein F5147DRAFT_777110 [Suillus discolor]|uniref:Uncharacterized protein n=1 Tax=Suillus discolor TaxID=1912936 RepID=A0A9P7EZT0_9AGAM|nr:uncharacterized protein F5147DRAFT_777110 [Suillus discolor]KAG2100201.1 hypothetical protein F5147DRAFT_777110 [Suillus discolor]